ncbi:MAG: hypothetical protein HY908_37155 [Myxococcales bacterium]|nr:hypothetical protein [Myxococcales bacterium]
MPRSKRLAALLALGAAVTATLAAVRVASAQPLLPDDDPALEALRTGYERLERTFATRENGLFLDPIADPAAVATIEGFFAQTATDDFASYAGVDPYAVLASYDEHGDEGNFAGIASVGVAARLLALRNAGAAGATLDRARDAAVRAARAWHVYGAIGGPGVVARGVRRVTPWSPGDAPFPGPAPTLVPLADANGDPLPADKSAVWRAPVAPGFDGWVWLDDTSKDQVSGYALAAAWLWDALHTDPLVPASVTDDLAADLGAFARALRQVAPEKGIDLCLRDADGRLTSFHDLNPRSLTPDGLPLPEDSTLRNGFNALLALGIVRAAYHVTGDPEIGAWYYDELVGRRHMARDPVTTVGLMYAGTVTNYSNVNMAAIGLATLGRFETDPGVRADLAETLATQFWSVDGDRDASHVGQPWFDAVVGAYLAAAPALIPARMAAMLGGFPPAPCLERDRTNCDAAELAAGSCLAVDGTTTIAIAGSGWGGGPVAAEPVPMSIRPDSDFMWRSDPHQVNGSASTRMDPRGDWLAAYWLGRLSELGAPDANLSPFARPPLSSGAGGAAAEPGDPGGGCACRTAAAPAPGSSRGALAALVAALGVVLGARRRCAPPR